MRFRDMPRWAQRYVENYIREEQIRYDKPEEWFRKVLDDCMELYIFIVDEEYRTVIW